MGGGVLRGLQRELRRRAADDDGQVVRRAGGGAERADLLVEEGQHPLGVQDGLGLLVEERLVRRAAALGHEQELVLGLPAPLGGRRVQLDLRRQVGAGVLLLVRRQGRELGVAQVELRVRVVDATADRLAVVGPGEHALRLLAHHDRGAGVLAHRQHAAGGDVDVLEQVERDEAVVPRRLGVVDDLAQLGQVGRAQVVGDVVHRLGGQPLDRLGRDLEEGAAVRLERRDPLGRHQRGTACRRRRAAAGRSSGIRDRSSRPATLVRTVRLARMEGELERPDPARMRVSDEDRHKVADILREAAAEGRIDIEELDERLESTYAAKTYGDLVPITADLPGAARQRCAAPRARSRPSRWCPRPATTPRSRSWAGSAARACGRSARRTPRFAMMARHRHRPARGEVHQPRDGHPRQRVLGRHRHHRQRAHQRDRRGHRHHGRLRPGPGQGGAEHRTRLADRAGQGDRADVRRDRAAASDAGHDASGGCSAAADDHG